MPTESRSPSSVQRAFRAASLVALSVAASCASSDARSAIREQRPAPLKIVVEAPKSSVTPTSGSALQFRATGAEMQRMLADELRALDACSQVVVRGQPGDDDYDIALSFEPRGPISLSHSGTSGFLAAGGLWLVTWIGGLLVPDSTYAIRMDAGCRVELMRGVEFEREIRGGETDLSFLQRNDIISMSGLQSLVLPPFWTTDQADTTSAALTSATMRIAAQDIAKMLKTDFEKSAGASALGCAIDVVTPKNGEIVTTPTTDIEVVLELRNELLLKSVNAFVNGGAKIPLTAEGRTGRVGLRYRGRLENLRPGEENWVRIEIDTDTKSTRTLRLAPARR